MQRAHPSAGTFVETAMGAIGMDVCVRQVCEGEMFRNKLRIMLKLGDFPTVTSRLPTTSSELAGCFRMHLG